MYVSIATNTNYFAYVNTGSSTVLSWTITGLLRGTLYYIKVTATNLIGESPSSLETAILAATVPLAPNQPTVSL